MLRSTYLGVQAPRKYPIRADPASGQPDSAAARLPSICSRCNETVWTNESFSKLRELPSAEQKFVRVHEMHSSELRASVMQNCQFCKSLADGVHGKVFLDALYERWSKTESWASSGSDGEQEDEVKLQDDGSDVDKEDNRWNDASAFNEEFFEDDITGGWDAYDDRDTLDVPCQFCVTFSFERGEDGLFAFLNVHIESIDAEDDNAVRRLRDDKAVELRYHLNRGVHNEKSPSRRDDSLFPPFLAEAALGSLENIRRICDWTGEVLNIAQPTALDSLRIPKRLIEVSATGIRIVESATIDANEAGSAKGFVALSYVWGRNQTFVLTAATRERLHSSFSMQDLPQTIQDAITITRAIGLNYLWVDALCILQDSPADKATELPKMRLIYERAAVTLVASVAPSATEGFLHHKPSPSYSISPIHIQNHHDPASALILSYPAAYDRRADPINLRAWTFQELLLSRRAVLFSYRGLDFVNRTNISAADGDTSGRDPQLPNLPWSGPLFRLTDIEPENLRSVWLTVRGEYSRRNLSYAGDKLLAVSAVAEEIGRGYGSKYLAGLWEKGLESELKWSRADPSYVGEPGTPQARIKGRPEEYVAPSWSWASIESPVDDFHVDGEGTPLEDKLGFEIVKCEVELAVPGFEYGAVVSGSLRVRGRVHSFFWRPHEEGYVSPDQTDGFLAVKSGAGSYEEMQVGEAILDAVGEGIVQGCVVDVLAMGLIEQIPGRVEVEGLLIVPISEDEDSRCKRVGFAKVRVKELFEDCEEMEVVLI